MSEYRLLAEEHDPCGVMRIIEAGDYRFLEFGEEVEQSCCFVPDPCWLEYDYTRAMLLGALLPARCERALFLGLGGGSLTNACLHYLPLVAAEAIELRAAVVNLAQRFMGLTQDPRLTIHVGDAAQHLERCAPADVIFLDLYTDQGPAALHLACDFLRRCRARLRPGGWLVINQWSTLTGQPLGAPLLRGLFGHGYLQCPLAEGNVVLYVPADDEQAVCQVSVEARAQALEARLGYSLTALLARWQTAR